MWLNAYGTRFEFLGDSIILGKVWETTEMVYLDGYIENWREEKFNMIYWTGLDRERENSYALGLVNF